MANLDQPMGLRPAYHYAGGIIRLSRYKIASGYGTSIGQGDPVILTGTGKEINRGSAATAPFCGVFMGVSYRDTDGNYVFKKYWPASTATLNSEAADAFVIDDPDVVFEVQGDEDIVAADIGQTADVVFGTVDTVFGNGRCELDSSDIGTGANLFILDIVDRPENEAGSANTKAHVLINEHDKRNAGAASFGTA